MISKDCPVCLGAGPISPSYRRLSDAGEEMRVIGDMWQEAASLFHKADGDPDPSVLLHEASVDLLRIADREQAFWQHLNGIVRVQDQKV